MKYLKLFESYDNIVSLCEKYNIENYTINNGVVDVDGDVNLSRSKFSELPLKFGVVAGNFYCGYGVLTSLEGCPNKVFGQFNCQKNRLTSLKGCPKHVGDNFYCHKNMITSLEGCPTYIGMDFDCYENELTSLLGCPREIGGYFSCSQNNLISLEFGPVKTGDYYCDNNKLYDLRGIALECGELECGDNPVHEIYNLFPNHQSFMDSLDYDYFRGGNKINKIRLTQALLEFDLKCPGELVEYDFI